MRREPSSHSGFTLIELLLSLSIFLIISIAVYSTFAGGVQVWRKAQEFSSTSQTTRLILEKMAGDLRNTVRITGSEFIGEPQKLSFLVLRRSPAAAAPSTLSEIRRITYELKRDEASEHDALFRLDESYAEGLQEGHREPDVLAGPIAGLALQYAFKGEDEETAREWKDIWEGNGIIPTGVKITLKMPGRQEEEALFTKVVFMPLGLQGEKNDEAGK